MGVLTGQLWLWGPACAPGLGRQPWSQGGRRAAPSVGYTAASPSLGSLWQQGLLATSAARVPMSFEERPLGAVLKKFQLLLCESCGESGCCRGGWGLPCQRMPGAFTEQAPGTMRAPAVWRILTPTHFLVLSCLHIAQLSGPPNDSFCVPSLHFLLHYVANAFLARPLSLRAISICG